ncbi:MAG TPA: DUF2461 domain-containing protein [Mucilaginibacter sp.]|jgi:uncharacterized protein (TIGR02453 family)|nr:DUF2461 domain-containing protein [Mucilaginibacter sp.]
MAAIQKDTFQFLYELKDNNDREWFNTNKNRYVAANENFISFIQSLINEAARFEPSMAGLDAKKTVFRIYRDTRFAKDKSPYKTNFGAWLAGKDFREGVAGYYFHLQPGASFIAGGVHMPGPARLKTLRQELSHNGAGFLEIVNNKNFKEKLELRGDKTTKVPPGFEKDDPMVEFIKFKELMVHHQVDDKTVLSDNFTAYCAGILSAMAPFNAFLNASSE